MLNPSVLFYVTKTERLELLKLWYLGLNFNIIQPFSYFSAWNIIIFIIITFFIQNPSPILYKLKFNTLLQTSIGGFYISYIFPRFIKIPYLNIIIDRSLLYFIDFFSHHFLFLYTLFYEKNIPSFNFSEFFIMNIPFFLYFYIFNIFGKYNIYPEDFISLFQIYLSSIFIIFAYKKIDFLF